MAVKRGTRLRKKKRSTSVRVREAASPDGSDPIRHVVVLSLENRSFDHMLGCMQAVIPDLDGVPTVGARRRNVDPAGVIYEQLGGASRVIAPDPMHETSNVLRQLENGNQGFVSDYARKYPETGPAQRQQVMAYHDVDSLYALHSLARSFAVCDRWFCSVPGPTWTNRLFALSGTSLGRVKMPTGIFDLNLHRYDQDTIFDRLRAARRTWRIYFGDFPLTLLFAHQRKLRAVKDYSRMRHFGADAASATEDPKSFPEFVFIEPSYLWPSPNDDHPPHDVLEGQRLIANVYGALRANEALWKSTLLVVTYDEHGGFYDHVEPPAAIPPDDHHEEYAFDRLGVRVPAILASPWIRPGVVHDVFDHTSVLRYLCDKWALAPLGRRTAAANSIGVALQLDGAPREDAPIRAGAPAAAPRALRALARDVLPPELNDNQKAILSLSQVLEKETRDAAEAKLARSMRLMRGPVDQLAIARARAEQFLRERGAKL
jgi:phospholipase C